MSTSDASKRKDSLGHARIRLSTKRAASRRLGFRRQPVARGGRLTTASWPRNATGRLRELQLSCRASCDFLTSRLSLGASLRSEWAFETRRCGATTTLSSGVTGSVPHLPALNSASYSASLHSRRESQSCGRDGCRSSVPSSRLAPTAQSTLLARLRHTPQVRSNGLGASPYSPRAIRQTSVTPRMAIRCCW